MNFAKYLRTSFLQNTSRQLLLELETQHDRLSFQEWRNCQNCEKMPTRLECVCCNEIPEVKVFNLKSKARLSWSIADFSNVHSQTLLGKHITSALLTPYHEK